MAGWLIPSYTRKGPPADGVYTRHALHQLPDFWKALVLQRTAGMLRPGGVLRLRDLIYDEHIRTEFSTFRWLLEPMLAQAGFEIVTAEFEGRLYGAYTGIKSGGWPGSRPHRT